MGGRDRIVVVGIGNPDRGDDAVGRLCVRRLAERLPPGIEPLEQTGEATALLAALEEASCAFVVDASAAGREPGRVQRFDVTEAALPAGAFGMSTHGFGLVEALELARSLGVLPPYCVVYAVEGGSFADGAALTPAVEAAMETVEARLLRELDTLNDPGTRSQEHA